MQLGGSSIGRCCGGGTSGRPSGPCFPPSLVLYDSTDPTYGFIGELLAMMVVNQYGRFGGWTAQPVANSCSRRKVHHAVGAVHIAKGLLTHSTLDYGHPHRRSIPPLRGV
jgi:hypothetical protein